MLLKVSTGLFVTTFQRFIKIISRSSSSKYTMSAAGSNEQRSLEENIPKTNDEEQLLVQTEFPFQFNDCTLEDQPSKEVCSKDVRELEKLRKNQEAWNDIKAQKLRKGHFPDVNKCFPSVVTDSFKSIRNRPLVDVTAVFRHNAWDNIEWDDEMRKEAEQKIQNNSSVMLDCEKKEVYENEAPKFWDTFYGIHQNKFFKERNWLLTEFPELQSPFGCSVDSTFASKELRLKRPNENFPGENSKFRVLEIGCGNGSTVFPLLSMNNNPELFIYCCDFSSTAVDVVKNSPKFEPARSFAFTYDATAEIRETSVPFPLESLDVITIIFVLSAISPDKFDKVLSNLHKLLKPGGLILFRDYAKYDLVQLRFPQGRCISENFYVRGDGTRVYFFEQNEVENLFERNGFTKETTYVDKRLQVNRLKQLKMYRVWLLGKFRKA